MELENFIPSDYKINKDKKINGIRVLMLIPKKEGNIGCVYLAEKDGKVYRFFPETDPELLAKIHE